jgi:hypothetical protein
MTKVTPFDVAWPDRQLRRKRAVSTMKGSVEAGNLGQIRKAREN